MNTSSAAEANQSTGLDLEGLESFYDVESSTVQEQPGTSRGTAQTEKSYSGTAQRLTVEDAAKRLGISPNAVIKRLAKGKLDGLKVPGRFGERWMVDAGSLPQEIHVQIAEEQPGNSQGTAEHATEQPTIQQEQATHNGATDQALAILADVISQQTEQIKVQNEVIKQLSAQMEAKDGQIIKLLTDSAHRQSWWAQVCSWFKAAPAS